MSYLDKTFCASPQCKNNCKRQMTEKDKDYYKELAFRGLAASSLVSYAYFCGEPELIPTNINQDLMSIGTITLE